LNTVTAALLLAVRPFLPQRKRKRTIINMSGYKKNDQLLDKTSDVQDKTLKSLDRTRATVLKAEESGNATLEKLHEQGDQMVLIPFIMNVFVFLGLK
jgi:hypothetical protein